jgi:hypothetical protein
MPSSTTFAYDIRIGNSNMARVTFEYHTQLSSYGNRRIWGCLKQPHPDFDNRCLHTVCVKFVGVRSYECNNVWKQWDLNMIVDFQVVENFRGSTYLFFKRK